MPFFGFERGVHPPYNKDTTSESPIEVMPVSAGKLYYVSLAQHIGAPAKPVVVKGQEVRAGELIGKASGLISANVHSPVSGKVIALENVLHPSMGTALGVVLESSDNQSDTALIESDAKLQQIVFNAGIVGLGGATFPTNVKLSPPKKIDVLLINGAECEPYLTCDHRLMVEKTEEILKGCYLIKDALNIPKIIIGIENNKPDAIYAFERYKSLYDFELIQLDVKYPQGGEKQLIKSCLNKTVPEGALPLEIGVIVHNVGTCFAVFDAVENKKPLTERVITVTGGVKEPKNLLVKVGTPVKDIIDFCGGFAGQPKKIIMGGPMMGFALSSVDTPVMKGTSGILVQLDEDLPSLKQFSCIRCGRCIDACPMGLMPSVLERFVMNEMYESLAKWHLMNCIECGCCSYICPSRRDLVGGFKASKRKVLKFLKEQEVGKNG